MRTIEQERAALAWQQVESVAHANGFGEYSQLLQGLPVTIHTAGLGQTVAFFRAKGENNPNKPHTRVLMHLAAWLLRDRPQNQQTPDGLMQAIHGGDSHAYRRLTAEAHAYLAWLKRFAAARASNDAARAHA